MKKIIGKRILKTGIAVSASLMLSGLLGFNTTFSGVVALIGLKETTKKTFTYGITLIFGSLLSLLLGIGVFYLLGNNPFAFGIGTIIIISLLVTLKLNEGLILSVIVMYHVLEHSPEKISDFFSFSITEFTVILIGISVSILINFVFPQKYNRFLEKKLEELYIDLSSQLEVISAKVKKPESIQINISDIEKSRKNIKKIIARAEISKDNIINETNKEQYEVLIRKLKTLKKLLYMLEDMSNEANRITESHHQSQVISKSLEILKRIQRFPEHTTVSSYKRLSNSLNHLHDEFKSSPLPESRVEFEDRSSLYHLYLSILEYADHLFLLHDKCIIK